MDVDGGAARGGGRGRTGGLAAAAELVERGEQALVLERGDRAGAAVSRSGTTSGCSPGGPSWSTRPPSGCWPPTGWVSGRRSDTYPTGAEWAERYLRPLAEAARRPGAVRRRGRRCRAAWAGPGGRRRAWDTEPLTVHVRDGRRRRGADHRACGDRRVRHVGFDPNPLGGDGLPALGEHAAADRISYRVPDLTDDDVRARYAGRHRGGRRQRALGADRAGRVRRPRRAGARRPGSPGCCAAARSARRSVAASRTSCLRAARWGCGPRPRSRPGTSRWSPGSAPSRSSARRTG